MLRNYNYLTNMDYYHPQGLLCSSSLITYISAYLSSTLCTHPQLDRFAQYVCMYIQPRHESIATGSRPKAPTSTCMYIQLLRHSTCRTRRIEQRVYQAVNLRCRYGVTRGDDENGTAGRGLSSQFSWSFCYYDVAASLYICTKPNLV